MCLRIHDIDSLGAERNEIKCKEITFYAFYAKRGEIKCKKMKKYIPARNSNIWWFVWAFKIFH